MKKLLFALSTALILLTSCQREETLQNTGGSLLQKEVMTTYDHVVYTTVYRYNNLNKLIEIQSWQSDMTGKNIIEVKHDAQGRMSQTLSYYVNDSNVVVRQLASVSFIYDNNNRIVKSLYTSLSPTTTEGWNKSLGYDANGRVVRDSSFSSVDGSLKEYAVFFYNDNNNAVEKTEYFAEEQAPIATWVNTYDDKLTPHSNLGTDYYFILSGALNYNYSVNNITKWVREGDEAEIVRYEYDASGRVLKAFAYPENHPQFTSAFEYFYQ